MDEEAIFRARQKKSGAKGGLSTKSRHGTKFFAAIARKRWRKAKKKVVH